ncbi:sinapoylglucose--choline O-sinapoyltransferase [Ranunculus cassubicifolius]
MAETKLILLSFLLLCFLQNIAAKAIVKHLPGVVSPLPFELETGYVNVGDGHYAYYFVKSYNKPATDPLLFSFAGGPGCSSLAILLFGQGPLTINMIPFNGSIPTFSVNPNSWTHVANIVYIDQPVDTGFSYSTNLQGAYSDDISSAKTSHIFIKKWLDDHQDFQSNPVYVVGDGYGGIVLPILVQNIANGNDAGEKPLVNLKGYFLGNPIVNRHLERNAAIEFAHGMALISEELFESVQKTCGREYVYVDPNNVECLKDLQDVTECLQDLNLYQILNRNCFPRSKKSREASISPLPDMEKLSCENEAAYRNRRSLEENSKSRLLSPPPPFDTRCNLVYLDWLNHYYVNNETVQDALHIRKGTVPDWQRCNQCGIKYTRNVVNSFDYYADLSKRGIRSLIYSGDYDYSVPFMSTQSWIKSLNYSITDDWRPWTVDGQVAGFTRTYANNMTYATVKGTGHASPEYKPEECLAMVKRWLSNEPL